MQPQVTITLLPADFGTYCSETAAAVATGHGGASLCYLPDGTVQVMSNLRDLPALRDLCVAVAIAANAELEAAAAMAGVQVKGLPPEPA